MGSNGHDKPLKKISYSRDALLVIRSGISTDRIPDGVDQSYLRDLEEVCFDNKRLERPERPDRSERSDWGFNQAGPSPFRDHKPVIAGQAPIRSRLVDDGTLHDKSPPHERMNSARANTWRAESASRSMDDRVDYWAGQARNRPGPGGGREREVERERERERERIPERERDRLPDRGREADMRGRRWDEGKTNHDHWRQPAASPVRDDKWGQDKGDRRQPQGRASRWEEPTGWEGKKREYGNRDAGDGYKRQYDREGGGHRRGEPEWMDDGPARSLSPQASTQLLTFAKGDAGQMSAAEFERERQQHQETWRKSQQQQQQPVREDNVDALLADMAEAQGQRPEPAAPAPPQGGKSRWGFRLEHDDSMPVSQAPQDAYVPPDDVQGVKMSFEQLALVTSRPDTTPVSRPLPFVPPGTAVTLDELERSLQVQSVEPPPGVGVAGRGPLVINNEASNLLKSVLKVAPAPPSSAPQAQDGATQAGDGSWNPPGPPPPGFAPLHPAPPPALSALFSGLSPLSGPLGFPAGPPPPLPDLPLLPGFDLPPMPGMPPAPVISGPPGLAPPSAPFTLLPPGLPPFPPASQPAAEPHDPTLPPGLAPPGLQGPAAHPPGFTHPPGLAPPGLAPPPSSSLPVSSQDEQPPMQSILPAPMPGLIPSDMPAPSADGLSPPDLPPGLPAASISQPGLPRTPSHSTFLQQLFASQPQLFTSQPFPVSQPPIPASHSTNALFGSQLPPSSLPPGLPPPSSFPFISMSHAPPIPIPPPTSATPLSGSMRHPLISSSGLLDAPTGPLSSHLDSDMPNTPSEPPPLTQPPPNPSLPPSLPPYLSSPFIHPQAQTAPAANHNLPPNPPTISVSRRSSFDSTRNYDVTSTPQKSSPAGPPPTLTPPSIAPQLVAGVAGLLSPEAGTHSGMESPGLQSVVSSLLDEPKLSMMHDSVVEPPLLQSKGSSLSLKGDKMQAATKPPADLPTPSLAGNTFSALQENPLSSIWATSLTPRIPAATSSGFPTLAGAGSSSLLSQLSASARSMDGVSAQSLLNPNTRSGAATPTALANLLNANAASKVPSTGAPDLSSLASQLGVRPPSAGDHRQPNPAEKRALQEQGMALLAQLLNKNPSHHLNKAHTTAGVQLHTNVSAAMQMSNLVQANSLTQNQLGQGQLGQSQLGQNPLGQSHLGQSQLGQSQLGQSQLGQNPLGQSHLGQSQFGQSHLGQSHLGQSHLGQTQLGQTHLGQTHLGQTQLGQSQLGQSQMGQTQLGQSQMPTLAQVSAQMQMHAQVSAQMQMHSMHAHAHAQAQAQAQARLNVLGGMSAAMVLGQGGGLASGLPPMSMAMSMAQSNGSSLLRLPGGQPQQGQDVSNWLQSLLARQQPPQQAAPLHQSIGGAGGGLDAASLGLMRQQVAQQQRPGMQQLMNSGLNLGAAGSHQLGGSHIPGMQLQRVGNTYVQQPSNVLPTGAGGLPSGYQSVQQQYNLAGMQSRPNTLQLPQHGMQVPGLLQQVQQAQQQLPSQQMQQAQYLQQQGLGAQPNNLAAAERLLAGLPQGLLQGGGQRVMGQPGSQMQMMQGGMLPGQHTLQPANVGLGMGGSYVRNDSADQGLARFFNASALQGVSQLPTMPRVSGQ